MFNIINIKKKEKRKKKIKTSHINNYITVFRAYTSKNLENFKLCNKITLIKVFIIKNFGNKLFNILLKHLINEKKIKSNIINLKL